MTLCWADSMTANSSTSHDSFQIERHGDIAVFTPSPDVEEMPEDLIHQAAEFVLGPLREDPPAGLVIDLSQVEFFGSIFISFLLRCHMVVKKHGSDVVVAGANERLREAYARHGSRHPLGLVRQPLRGPRSSCRLRLRRLHNDGNSS